MLQELTAGRPERLGPLNRAISAFVQWGGCHMLRWEAAGSVLLELPSGRRVRFGPSRAPSEPLLKLHNYHVIANAARRGSIGFAEAYMDGDIECSDLTALFRFFVQNRDRFERAGRGLFKVRSGARLGHLFRRNSRRGSRRNISAHYDLGNAFFAPWLDPEMIYSSGLYARGAETLEAAQQAKLDLILELLDLSPGAHMLEIGCGWGALARRAALRHGVRVEGITLSREQLAHARAEAAKAGLNEQCSFRLQDYRETRGRYDRIVAIEMIEAVGEAYWPAFFATLHDRLKPGGAAVLQAITMDEARFETYRRKADFIQSYIFPGGMLPTQSAIERHASAAGLALDRVELFGPCYARTLRDWRARFDAAWDQIGRLGFDERFRRRWEYYLAYCEAGFEEGVIDVGAYRLRKA